MSPMPCSICVAPNRPEIEKAMISESQAKVASRFGKSKAAVQRHGQHAADVAEALRRHERRSEAQDQ